MRPGSLPFRDGYRPRAVRRGESDPVAGSGDSDRVRAGRAERREPRRTLRLPLAGELLALPARGA